MSHSLAFRILQVGSEPFFSFFNNFIYLLAVLAGSLLLTRLFCSCDERKLLFFAVYGLLIVVTFVAEHMLQ